MMDFGDAIRALKRGERVLRVGWNGRWLGYTIEGMISDHPACGDPRYGASFEPFIYMRTATGNFVPWLASQSDMLAEDWTLVG